jgi:maltose/moltooligosaccharide transporter
MRLDIKRTVLIGFAFLSICAFWQMYNSVIPLMLTETFHLDETLSGAFMAADNVLALFLLPLFGSLSDRCRHPWGRRMPFIVFGTAAAVVLMVFLPLLDNSYYASHATWKVFAFVAVLLCVLVAMGTYRSPAVALMPDVTPKPLRSQANAIINLMGAVGGIIYLAVAAVLYSSSRTEGLPHVDYLPLFVIVAVIMVVSVAIVFLTTDEPALDAKVAAYEEAHPEENLAQVDDSGKETLPPEVRRSLGFLLVSIALWFIGFNAMETWFTTYAVAMWGMQLGEASTCLMVSTLGAIVSYVPVAHVAARIGRKRTILIGIVMLAASFGFFAFWTFAGNGFSPVLYIGMVIVGAGWAAINVNSLPMVVEMCRDSDVGKFTGYYYTFSMAAQTVTPIVAGWLMHNVGYESLFVYAACFAAAAFVTMQFVHHGDARLVGKEG